MIALAEIIDLVESALDNAERAAGTYAEDPSGFHQRHRTQMEALAKRLTAQFGARCNDRWDGARVRLHGITSTSTTGIAGALRNWLRAAKNRAGEL